MSIDVVNAPGRDSEVVIEPCVSIMNVPRFMPVERNDFRIVGFAPLESVPETITTELVVLIALHLRGQPRNDNDDFDVACIVAVIMFGRGREHQRADCGDPSVHRMCRGRLHWRRHDTWASDTSRYPKMATAAPHSSPITTRSHCTMCAHLHVR